MTACFESGASTPGSCQQPTPLIPPPPSPSPAALSESFPFLSVFTRIHPRRLPAVCPACKLGRLRRSHRRGPLERALGLFGLYPYRCEQCGDRPWHSGGPPETPDVSLKLRLDTKALARAWRRRRGELWLYLLGLCAFVVFLYYITRDRTG
jgi:hypothetical protein